MQHYAHFQLLLNCPLMKNDYEGRWFMKGKPMDASSSYKLPVSLSILNDANVWPILRPFEGRPPVMAPSVRLPDGPVCTWPAASTAAGLSSTASWSVHSGFPADVNLSLSSESPQLLILFQVIVFFSFHTQRWLKENPKGETARRRRKEIALSCSFFLWGHSGAGCTSPAKTCRLCPDLLRWLSNVLREY